MRKLKRLFYSASELKGATCEVSSIVSTHETCLVLDVFDTRSAFFFSKLLTYSCLCELNSWTPEYSLDWTSVFLSFSQSLSVPEKDPNRVCVNWFRVRLHVRLYSYFNETHVWYAQRIKKRGEQETLKWRHSVSVSTCSSLVESQPPTSSSLVVVKTHESNWLIIRTEAALPASTATLISHLIITFLRLIITILLFVHVFTVKESLLL